MSYEANDLGYDMGYDSEGPVYRKDTARHKMIAEEPTFTYQMQVGPGGRPAGVPNNAQLQDGYWVWSDGQSTQAKKAENVTPAVSTAEAPASTPASGAQHGQGLARVQQNRAPTAPALPDSGQPMGANEALLSSKLTGAGLSAREAQAWINTRNIPPTADRESSIKSLYLNDSLPPERRVENRKADDLRRDISVGVRDRSVNAMQGAKRPPISPRLAYDNLVARGVVDPKNSERPGEDASWKDVNTKEWKVLPLKGDAAENESFRRMVSDPKYTPTRSEVEAMTFHLQTQAYEKAQAPQAPASSQAQGLEAPKTQGSASTEKPPKAPRPTIDGVEINEDEKEIFDSALATYDLSFGYQGPGATGTTAKSSAPAEGSMGETGSAASAPATAGAKTPSFAGPQGKNISVEYNPMPSGTEGDKEALDGEFGRMREVGFSPQEISLYRSQNPDRDVAKSFAEVPEGERSAVLNAERNRMRDGLVDETAGHLRTINPELSEADSKLMAQQLYREQISHDSGGKAGADLPVGAMVEARNRSENGMQDRVRYLAANPGQMKGLEERTVYHEKSQAMDRLRGSLPARGQGTRFYGAGKNGDQNLELYIVNQGEGILASPSQLHQIGQVSADPDQAAQDRSRIAADLESFRTGAGAANSPERTQLENRLSAERTAVGATGSGDRAPDFAGFSGKELAQARLNWQTADIQHEWQESSAMRQHGWQVEDRNLQHQWQLETEGRQQDFQREQTHQSQRYQYAMAAVQHERQADLQREMAVFNLLGQMVTSAFQAATSGLFQGGFGVQAQQGQYLGAQVAAGMQTQQTVLGSQYGPGGARV